MLKCGGDPILLAYEESKIQTGTCGERKREQGTGKDRRQALPRQRLLFLLFLLYKAQLKVLNHANQCTMLLHDVRVLLHVFYTYFFESVVKEKEEQERGYKKIAYCVYASSVVSIITYLSSLIFVFHVFAI